jgi:long-subunit fatty acid transport protein
MNIKIKLLPLLLVLIFSFNGLPQSQSGIAASFVDIGFGTRPMGMGGAFTGMADDINSIMWNPAGLTLLKTTEVAFTFTNQLNLIHYHYLAMGLPVSSNQGIGLAFIYSGDQALTEMTLQAGYAISFIDDFSAGINIKYRYATFGKNSLNPSDFQIFDPDEIQDGILNQVKGNASGFGLDFGLLYRLNEKVSFGIMLKDAYGPIKWNSHVDNPAAQSKGIYTETIPMELSTGASLRLIKDVSFNVDYCPSMYQDVSNKIRVGVEAKLVNIFYLRSGFQEYLSNEKEEKYAFGLGLDLMELFDLRVLIDYTFLIEPLANTQRFSLGFSF